jgi:hypothetical protein
MTVTIEIDYKIFNSLDWHTISLTPEEYFDKSYFEEYPDEEYEWDSLPEFEDAIDYLDIDLEKVLHTRIRIFDSIKNVSRTFSEALRNDGENYIVERVDKHVDKIEELTIICIKLKIIQQNGKF